MMVKIKSYGHLEAKYQDYFDCRVCILFAGLILFLVNFSCKETSYSRVKFSAYKCSNSLSI